MIGITLEQRLLSLSLVASLPASLMLLWLLVKHQYSGYLVALLAIFLATSIAISLYQIKLNVVNQFRSMTNLLDALVNGDFSLRGKQLCNNGAVSELTAQINDLADLLAKQRFSVKETQLLLAKVIAHIDVAVFTFDHNRRLTLVNHAGAALFDKGASDMLGTSAAELGIDILFEKKGQLVPLTFRGQASRFHIATDTFIEDNRPHTLIFMTNVQAVLRDEERRAWQNLIRVISHEINNSLTPIASLSQTLLSMPEANSATMQESLGLIQERAETLTSFIDSYQQLAKLPTPQPRAVDIRSELAQAATLFAQIQFDYEGEETQLTIDPALFRQLLINLLKNAQEAMQAQLSVSQAKVYFSWHHEGNWLTLTLRDTGNGLQNLNNLFVPFYSTKPDGNGIGLLLCRQIAEAHGGSLTLDNYAEGGCIATLRLPLTSSAVAV